MHVQNFTAERNRIHKSESEEQRIVELSSDGEELMIPKVNRSSFRIWNLIINIPRKHAGALICFTLEQFNAKPYLTMNMISAEL